MRHMAVSDKALLAGGDPLQNLEAAQDTTWHEYCMQEPQPGCFCNIPISSPNHHLKAHLAPPDCSQTTSDSWMPASPPFLAPASAQVPVPPASASWLACLRGPRASFWVLTSSCLLRSSPWTPHTCTPAFILYQTCPSSRLCGSVGTPVLPQAFFTLTVAADHGPRDLPASPPGKHLLPQTSPWTKSPPNLEVSLPWAYLVGITDSSRPCHLCHLFIPCWILSSLWMGNH